MIHAKKIAVRCCSTEIPIIYDAMFLQLATRKISTHLDVEHRRLQRWFVFLYEFSIYNFLEMRNSV